LLLFIELFKLFCLEILLVKLCNPELAFGIPPIFLGVEGTGLLLLFYTKLLFNGLVCGAIVRLDGSGGGVAWSA